MDATTSDVKQNVTLDFNWNITCLNQSELPQAENSDLYESYLKTQKENWLGYKLIDYAGYSLGTLIILSNLTVVISSGLLLRKVQGQRSTYLLLGNVSLADTFIGVGLLLGAIVNNSMSHNTLCIFQLGMLVCPAMVSIFSVGLIAVDRYIYIMHGLYYQRWFKATRVRIGISIIWMISMTLGFMPATGWVNSELISTRCEYVALFPGALILFNSVLSAIVIAVVVILYSIILVRALKTVKLLNKTAYNIDVEVPVIICNKPSQPKLRRSVSFNVSHKKDNVLHRTRSIKSKNVDNLVHNEVNTNKNIEKCIDNVNKTAGGSVFTLITTESNITERNNIINELKNFKIGNRIKKLCNIDTRKKNELNKWRAIAIVMLTTGSSIVTWMPFFIAVTSFVLCDGKMTNPTCMHIRHLLSSVLGVLAVFNSILNPLIYAWWHTEFQQSVKFYCMKQLKKYRRWSCR